MIVFEFFISNKKCLLLGNHKLPSQNEQFFLNEIKLTLNHKRPSQNELFFSE